MNIQLDQVYTFKMTNGEEVVARVVSTTDSLYTVSQPLSAVPTEKGIQLIFGIFTGDPKQNVDINTSAVAMLCRTRDEISDHYLEATTGIKAVRKPSIIMG